jgi:hypothetical protein
MIILYEGEKRDIIVKVVRRIAGAYILSSAERRILTAARAVVPGFDWAAATWDPAAAELSALFDSTAAGLTAPGIYYLQLRCTIGAERYETEIRVDVSDWGP